MERHNVRGNGGERGIEGRGEWRGEGNVNGNEVVSHKPASCADDTFYFSNIQWRDYIYLPE